MDIYAIDYTFMQFFASQRESQFSLHVHIKASRILESLSKESFEFPQPSMDKSNMYIVCILVYLKITK